MPERNWRSAQEEPEENGTYLCIVEYYKEPYNIESVELEYYGEWKITETWNLLLWWKWESEESESFEPEIEIEEEELYYEED